MRHLGKSLFNESLGSLDALVELANNVKSGVGREVPLAVEGPQLVTLPLLDLVSLPDRESEAKRIFLVQILQKKWRRGLLRILNFAASCKRSVGHRNRESREWLCRKRP